MEKYGNETIATIHYFKSENITSQSNSDIKAAIKFAVATDPHYYATKYASYLNPFTGGDNSVSNMAEAFAQRFKGVTGTLREDVVETMSGNMLLFPEVSADYRSADNVATSMDKLLHVLSRKYNIPFRVIHEPNLKWAGRYVNDGTRKTVFINTAYANESTPIHEYFHPFVRILRLRNPSLYGAVLSQAKALGDNRADEEEVVTDYLEAQSKKRTKSSYLEQFFEFIRKLLNISAKVSITEATTLSDLFKVADQGIDLSEENTLTSAYKKVDVLVDEIQNRVHREQKTPIDYIEKIRADNPKLITDDNSNYYKDENGNEVATRLTVFVGDKEYGAFSTKSRRFKEDLATAKARDFFASRGIDVKNKKVEDIKETVTLGEQEYTFEQVVAIEEESLSKGRVFGKMVHSFMQYMLETNPEVKAQAKDQALQYAKQYGKAFFSLELHPDLQKFAANIEEIIKVAGLKIDLDGTLGIPKSKQDRIAAEIILKSDLLVDINGKPIASTADGIVQHANGDITLLDWKTGGITSDINTPYLMAYGEKYDIPDSKLSRGHLELALRAMMLKAQYPDMAFRSIKIIRLDSQGKATAMPLDLQKYLYTIGDFYKDKHPEVYKTLVSKNLLTATEYEGTSASLDSVLERISHLPYEEQVSYLKSKLASLHKGKSKAQIERDSNVAVLSAAYTEALLEIEKLVGTDLKAKGRDIPSYPFIGGFKNFSDIANTKVQTLHKMLIEAKAKITSSNVEYDKEHLRLYKNLVLKENSKLSKVVDFVALASLTTSLVTFNWWGLGLTLIAHKVAQRHLNKTTKDHFAFMWQKSQDQGVDAYFMNNTDFYELNGVMQEMTEAQKAYRDFIRDSMALEYKKFANTIVGYHDGNENAPIYRYVQLKIPAVLPPDFMPRIPKDISEVREEEAFLANYAGLKTVLGDSVKRNLTSFIENTYNDNDDPIPLRYFKHRGSAAVQEGNHSWNVEAAFKSFMGSMSYKANMEPIYDVAVGVSNSLREEYDENGNPRYPNLTKWLDDEIYPQILATSKDTSVTSKRMNRKMGKIGSALTGIPENTPYVISQNRVLQALKSSVTYSVMSFKVFSPLRNAIMIALANLTQSTRNSVNNVVSNIAGVPPETFEGINAKAASNALQDYMKAKLLGNEENSKLWNLAKKFDWLPDNYPYEVNNDRLLSKAIQLSPTSHAFMFYNIGETFGALWQLAGIMQGTKIQDKDGKEVSMWDAYDEKGEWKIGVRGLFDKGNGMVEELTELTPLEIKSMKRAYEKLNGSYRKEEKTAIEATVLGDFLLQFHKYFYQYLKVLFANPYKDITVGRHVMAGKRPDGMPVYQWHSDVMEGQFRVLVGSIGAMASLTPKKSLQKYLNDTDKYGALTLKGHRARALGAAINTGLWFAMLLIAFKVGLDDDDEKSYLGKALRRTIDDLTRGANPVDLLGTIEKPIVAIDKISKTGQSLFELLTAGIAGKTTKDGLPAGAKGVLRATPWGAGYLQMRDAFKNEEQGEEYIFGIIPIR